MEANSDLLSDLGDVTGELVQRLRERFSQPNQRKVIERHWTVQEAAPILGVSDIYLRQLAREGKVPGQQHVKGSRHTFSLADLNQARIILKKSPINEKNSSRCFRLAISNYKGGVTKTTNTCNLAQYFALQGYRVLVVDLDPQGSATSLLYPFNELDIRDDSTVYPFFVDQTDSLATAVADTAWENIKLIPACLALSDAEFELPSLQIQQPNFCFWERLLLGLQTIEQNYDIVLIDTPPALSYLTLNAVWAADGLLIPTRASMIDLQALGSYFRGIRSTLRSIESAAGHRKTFAFVRVFISAYVGQTEAEQATAGWIRKMYAENVLDAHMVSSAAIQSAMSRMRTIYEIERPPSDKTYRRAIEYTDAVGEEILRLIKGFWARDDANTPVKEVAA